MDNKSMERKGKLKLGIVIVVLAVIVMAGFGSVAYAASGSTSQLEDERGIFNPFTLRVFQVPSDESVARPAIRIPVRPVLRSFFRPPLVNQTP
jgi:hypothetical protein